MKFFPVLLCLSLLTLAACGVKPGEVKPPSGAPDHFPAEYPDERLDPPPPPVTVDHHMPPL